MKRRCHYAETLTAGFIAILAMVDSSLRAVDVSSSAEQIVPRQTRVLLLAPIDATVNANSLAPLREQIVRLRQQYEFICRQFVVLGEPLVSRAAAAAPEIDVTGKEEKSPEVLDEIARRVGAEWVIRLIVKEIASDPMEAFDANKCAVHATLLIQIRDARQHAWLVHCTQVSRLTGGASPPELFIEVLNTATKEALSSVLAAFPAIVPVSQDGAIVDYLEGQTAPFVGDPEKSFRGLRALQIEKP